MAPKNAREIVVREFTAIKCDGTEKRGVGLELFEQNGKLRDQRADEGNVV